MKIYVAGPMSGLPDYNRPAFDAAAKRIRAAGYDVFNPAQADREDPDATDDKPRSWFLRRDIPELCRCDAIAVLPGWQESVGARLEVAVAEALDMPVLDAQTLQPLRPEGVLEEAARLVRGRRRTDYGHPRDNHARTAALWSAYLGVPITPTQVCMLNLLQKISRSVHRTTRDTIVDIAGYTLNIAILEGLERSD